MARMTTTTFLGGMILILLFIYFIPEREAGHHAERLALVMGNGAFIKAPLKNPANDARDMADLLRGLGFDVIYRKYADYRQMEEAVFEFEKGLRNARIGLFYFAGHGVQLNGHNYLLPAAARVRTESDLVMEGFELGKVLRSMQGGEKRAGVLLLDASRPNPFGHRFKPNTPGLAGMEAPPGILISFAAAPGTLSVERPGEKSPYTRRLIKHMSRPGLTLDEALEKTRIDVMAETGGKQRPWHASALRGELCFKRGEGASKSIRAKTQGPERAQTKASAGPKKVQTPKPPAHTALPGKNGIKQTSNRPLRIVDRDGKFIALSNGVIRNTLRGLEWVAGPDRSTDWYQAREWVGLLEVDGGGWRMPTYLELQGLYDFGEGRPLPPLTKNKILRKLGNFFDLIFRDGRTNMTCLLNITADRVWTCDSDSPSTALVYNFNLESDEKQRENRERAYGLRVLAVRYRKKALFVTEHPDLEMARDDVFVLYANGMVKDTRYQLLWRVGPDRETNWHGAKDWIDRLNAALRGWRMPSVDELRTLYRKRIWQRNMTPLLKTNGRFVWSRNLRDASSAWLLDFSSGKMTWRNRDVYDYRFRAFAVRSEHDG